MKNLFLILIVLLFSVQSYAAILVFSPNGTYVTKPDLATAAAAVDVTGKKVIVTSPQIVTTAIAWPSDRELAFEKGGYVTFSGIGALTGLTEVRPEYFGVNTIPGTTDMTTAVNKALAAIDANGGTLLLTSQYYVPNGINFTKSSTDFSHSWVIKGLGVKTSQIITNNANIGLDLGGRSHVTLEGFRLNDKGTTAKVGIARYRAGIDHDTNNKGGHNHVYRDIQVEGIYSIAGLYSIGSEVNNHFNIDIRANGNGAAVYTTGTNAAGLTAALTIDGGSNSVNNFYGGTIAGAPGTTGGAIKFPTGIAGNWNFYGTYFFGWAGGYIIKLGDASSDAMQGQKVFNGCRFEGTGVTFTITGQQVWGLKVINSIFGQSDQDIKWTNTGLTGTGLQGSLITGNFHYDRGMTIPVVTDTTMNIPGTSVYHGTLVTINGGVVNSVLEGDHITIAPTTPVYGSVIVDNDSYTGTRRIKYGPNTVTSAGNSQGSAIVNKPFGTAPTSPEGGQLVSADGSRWNVTPLGCDATIPAFYDGSSWLALYPLGATPARATSDCTKGTIAYDSSYLYICVATNKWRRVAIEGLW